MKNPIKRILLAAGVMLCASSIQAQIIPEFGLKGGLNLATIHNVDDTDFKPGALAGVFVKLNVPATPMAIQPELLFVQYGGADANSDATQTINYIQVPVILKFGFDLPAAPVAPNVFFGPYLGTVLSTEADDGAGNTTDIDDLVNDTDIGVVFGAGLDISKFRLEVRYTAGLTDIYNDLIADGEKNGGLALTLGIGF